MAHKFEFKIESKSLAEKILVDMNAPASPTLMSMSSKHSRPEEE
jgi:hypothetical protein